jgi:hypothetical protein
MASTPAILESSGYCLWGHLPIESLEYAVPVDNEEASTDIHIVWMSVRLYAMNAAVLDETCRGVRWVSWRTF